MKSDEFRTLRAGAVYGAASPVKPGTARAWVANNGLRLGDRDDRDEGNPRYGLPDVARLLMMHWLTARGGMSAQPATEMTNAAWDTIEALSATELASIDDRSVAPDMPRMILSFDRVDGTTRPTIEPYASHDRERIMETRVELRELVRMARDRLVNELGHSLSGLRHDFADAPDPA